MKAESMLDETTDEEEAFLQEVHSAAAFLSLSIIPVDRLECLFLHNFAKVGNPLVLFFDR